KEDRLVLNQAYAYAYSQRVGGWFDRCHQALWTVLKRENNIPALVKLFRLSSFVWRLNGNQEMEKRYLSEVAETQQSNESLSGNTAEHERIYLIVRMGRVLGRVIDATGLIAKIAGLQNRI